MWRAIGSVVAGYVTMFVTVFCTFTVAYLVLGTDRVYKPGVFDVSTTWIVVSVVLSIVAAILGGLVCALIARTPTPPKVLAALVLLLGLGMSIPVFMDTKPDPGPRPAGVSSMEAMMKSKQPKWTAAANAVIGAAGVLIGAGLVRRGRGAAPKPN